MIEGQTGVKRNGEKGKMKRWEEKMGRNLVCVSYILWTSISPSPRSVSTQGSSWALGCRSCYYCAVPASKYSSAISNCNLSFITRYCAGIQSSTSQLGCLEALTYISGNSYRWLVPLCIILWQHSPSALVAPFMAVSCWYLIATTNECTQVLVNDNMQWKHLVSFKCL